MVVVDAEGAGLGDVLAAVSRAVTRMPVGEAVRVLDWSEWVTDDQRNALT
jgi:hypothetical protein